MKKYFNFFMPPSKLRIRGIRITEGTESWKWMQQVAHIHKHNSPEKALNDGMGLWKVVGEEINKGTIFQAVYPDGTIAEVDLPYPPQVAERKKVVLRVVVDNTNITNDEL